MLAAILMDEREGLRYEASTLNSSLAGSDFDPLDTYKIKDPFADSFSKKEDDDDDVNEDTDEEESTLRENPPQVQENKQECKVSTPNTSKLDLVVADVEENIETKDDSEKCTQDSPMEGDEENSIIPCNQEALTEGQRESRSEQRPTVRPRNSSTSRSRSSDSRQSTYKSKKAAIKKEAPKQSRMDTFMNMIYGKRKSSISPVNNKSAKQHKAKNDEEPP